MSVIVPEPRAFCWVEMVALCRRLRTAIPSLSLPDHRIVLHELRPYRMPAGWSVEPHTHAYFEASILLEGQAQYPAAGGPQLLRAGQVVFHGPGVTHCWSAPQQSCLRLVICFELAPTMPVPRPAQWPYWPHLLAEVGWLFAVTRTAATGWRDQAAARLATLLAQVLTLGEQSVSPADDGIVASSLFQAVDLLLRDNLSRALSLEDIASCLDISVSSLTHRFQAQAGKTVMQHLTALRMEKVAQLLVETPLPLTAICRHTGVSDPAYLCRLFQRAFRTTPMRYRKGRDDG